MLCDTDELSEMVDLKELTLWDDSPQRKRSTHPTVPKPYTLLSLLSLDHQWNTILDLKNAFFRSAFVPPKSQPYFIFERHDSEIGVSCWPAPIYHEDSKILPSSDVRLLQQVDDLLFAVRDGEICLTGTELLLWYLGDIGCHTSVRKVQTCKQQVMYLGSTLKRGQWCLLYTRKETVIKVKTPTIARKVKVPKYRELSPLMNSNFDELVKPWNKTTKEGQGILLTEYHQQVFDKVKQSLLSVLVLDLPDSTKPFNLFVDEHKENLKVSWSRTWVQ